MTRDSQTGTKPLQRLTEKERNADGKRSYKEMADYLIGNASFDDSSKVILGSSKQRNKKMLYEIYNNQFPLEFFDHVVNPYNTKNEDYKKWAAKIRPTTILRTNLDQLMSEYPKRPFPFYVSNLGEDAYNAFTDGLNAVVEKALQKTLIKAAEQSLRESGQSMGDEAGQIAQEEIPTPEDVATAYKASYKDKLAIQGQKRLNRLMAELGIKPKLQKMFKDWIIAGEARSYKGVHNSVLTYKRISTLNIDHDKSPDVELIEDGDWVVARYLMTYSDVVDRFYEDLNNEDHKALETGIDHSSPMAFYDSIKGLYTNSADETGKIPVYHACWKGKQLVKKVTSTDPLTGEEHVDYLDESYPLAEGETSENIWVNCVYETYRIGAAGKDTDKGIYVRMQELPHQRNEMNNVSACKLPYNGKNFSDDHAQNISLVEIGLPFQIMYIIVSRALELTISKSKGKVVLLDKNVIPTKDGWDEDKFFYYSEALGWGLIDRNKMGVDKSFNQYQVLDLTLYDSIQQLIELQGHLKNEWDEILGFSRQRKGQTYASDTAGSNSEALFQSTVITDMIFMGFEDFAEKELQGILDLSKFTNTEGIRQIYNQSELDYEILESDPVEYAAAELGLFVSKNEIDKLKRIQSYGDTFAMNGAKPSTVLELITADNVAMLKAVLKKTEDLEAQAAQAAASSEQEGAQALEEIRARYLQTQTALDTEFMNAEYDRKEAIEHIKGEYALHKNKDLNDGDNNDNGIPDGAEIFDRLSTREQLMQADMHKSADLRTKQQEIALKNKDLNLKNKQELIKRNLELKRQKDDNVKHAQEMQQRALDRKAKGEIEKLKARTALRNKTAGEK